jgi:hypothetical protein
MLDRKTKDYEASEELLEDKIKQSRILSGIYYFLYLIFLLILVYICIQTLNIDFTKIKEINSMWRLLFIELTGGLLLLSFVFYSFITSSSLDNDIRYYKTLLFLKKNYTSDREIKKDEKKRVE